MVSVVVKHHEKRGHQLEFRSCVKEEVAILGSPSLTVRTVSSVEVKQHGELNSLGVQEMCERRDGHPESNIDRKNIASTCGVIRFGLTIRH